MKLSKLKTILDALVPKSAGWDGATGERYSLQGDWPTDPEIESILYCVTPSEAIMQYAMARGYDAVISHHPYQIAGYIPQFIYHTALDCVPGGLNDWWADMFLQKELSVRTNFDGNLGRVIQLRDPTSIESIIRKTKSAAGIVGEIWSEDPDQEVSSICICTGLGGMVTKEAAESRADLYITGELCAPAEESGFKHVIETGHTISESRSGWEFFSRRLPITVGRAPEALDKFADEIFLLDPFGKSLTLDDYGDDF